MRKLICLFIICIMFINCQSIYAVWGAGDVVFDPTAFWEALDNKLKTLDEMNKQFEELAKISSDAKGAYEQTLNLAKWRGNYKDMNPFQVVNEISRESNRKLNNTTSLFNSIERKADKKIVSGGALANYIPGIDTETWAFDKEMTTKEKIAPHAVLLEKIDFAEEYATEIHGWVDEAGNVYTGELDRLNKKLEEAKAVLDLPSTKDDVSYNIAMDEVKAIQDQMDFLTETEAQLKKDIASSKAVIESARDMKDQVIENRLEEGRIAAFEDKEIHFPSQESIYDYFRKQEKDAI